MKPHVDAMILTKFRDQLLRHAPNLPSPTLVALERLYFELERKLAETITESAREQQDLETQLNDAEGLIRWFAEYGERVKEFMGDVEVVDTDS